VLCLGVDTVLIQFDGSKRLLTSYCRWFFAHRTRQRFQNFEKAYLLFDEAMQMDSEKLSQLEKEGIIQRFEVVIELYKF
jgi:hypothetical protein